MFLARPSKHYNHIQKYCKPDKLTQDLIKINLYIKIGYILIGLRIIIIKLNRESSMFL